MQKIHKVVLFSREEICSLFNVGPNNGQLLWYNDDFPAIKIGRDWFVEENALIGYLQNRHILTDLRSKKTFEYPST